MPSASALRVFVVDDSEMWRGIIARTLANKFPDLAIEEAADGEQALNLAICPPDLIITDLMMPVCDGYTMIERLRGNPHTAHVPVLVVSGRSTSESITRLTQLDIQGFLLKPFSIEDLVISVEAVLRRRAGRDAVRSLPRSAVRRIINETVHLLYPVCALTPRGFCVSLGEAVGKGARYEFDLSEARRALGCEGPDGLTSCVIKERRVVGPRKVAVVEPLSPDAALLEAMQRRLRAGGGPCPDVLPLPEWDWRLWLPAHSADLSATGMRILAPFALPVGEVLGVSIRSIARAISGRAASDEVLCRVVRYRQAGDDHEAGLQFEQAAPELIADVLRWSTQK